MRFSVLNFLFVLFLFGAMVKLVKKLYTLKQNKTKNLSSNNNNNNKKRAKKHESPVSTFSY